MASGDINKKHQNHLVYGTWVLAAATICLVIVGIIGIFLTKSYMSKQIAEMKSANEITKLFMSEQIAEMKKATQLQWRPFLVFKEKPDTYDWRFYYDNIGNDSTMQGFRSLDSIKIGGDAYVGVKRIRAVYKSSLNFSNTGATPLRVTRFRHKGLSENDWINTYEKSVNLLIQDVGKRSPSDSLEWDVVLQQNEPQILPFVTRGIISISIADFERYRDTTKILPVYSYVYIEYEDFFENKYNSIMVVSYNFSIDTKDGFIVLSPPETPTLEKYRWDVELTENIQ